MSFWEMITILGAAFGGAVIGAFISHCFTTQRENKRWKLTLELQTIQEYNKAATIFRSAFSGAIRKLKQEYDKSGYEILVGYIEQHEIAMIQFKPYLSDGEQEKLDATWKEYAGSDKNNPDHIDLNIYHWTKSKAWKKEYKDKDEMRQARERIDKRLRNDAIQRIEKLLHISKPK